MTHRQAFAKLFRFAPATETIEMLCHKQRTHAGRVASLRARLADVNARRLELVAALFDAPEREAKVLRGKRRDLVDDLGALPVQIGEARRREVLAQLAYLYEVARFARETAKRLQAQLSPLEAQQRSIKKQMVAAEQLQQQATVYGNDSGQPAPNLLSTCQRSVT